MRILVVDHSDAVRARLVERLREQGLDVVGETGDLVGAVALAARLMPDAIVTDVVFPEYRGAEVVLAVRHAAPAAHLVVVTNEKHHRAHCLACGADHFLDKSKQFDEIAAALMHYVH